MRHVHTLGVLFLLPSMAASAAESAEDDLFTAQIAPLLAKHCLECHDTGTRKGRLDLSKKEAAFAGGKHGKAIIPGKPGNSALWTSVESDEMPQDRPALTKDEKQLLRRWIASGAVWTGDAIDPHLANRDTRATSRWIQRLTVPEYIATVRDAVGVDIAADARRLLPPDGRADGFSNTAYNLNIDLDHVQAYARLARLIVQRVDIAQFAGRFGHKTPLKDDGAARDVISRMGHWLLRGPLDDRELTTFLSIPATVKQDGGDDGEALTAVVEAMLQSPRFIYRIERQRGDGTVQPPTQHELASRISYILWGAPPDEKLLAAADAGDLTDSAKLAAQVQRMAQDPRTIERSVEFISEWLHLDRLRDLSPEGKRFPTWNAQLADDMRQETIAFFKDVAWEQRRPLSDLLNARLTYATPRLAAHYGLKADPSAALTAAAAVPGEQPKDPTLQALYLFHESGGGGIIRDASGAHDPMDLKVTTPEAVAWQDGHLRFHGSARVGSEKPAARFIEAVKKSKAFTVEVWLTAADTKQGGPARILTLSAGTSARNFTLGQNGNQYQMRLRTTKTSPNGEPVLETAKGAVTDSLAHFVYTRHANGKTIMYLDGQQVGVRDVGGDLSNWDGGFHLALGNETTGDRPWRGSLHRIALYSRAFSVDDIRSADGSLMRYDLTGVPARGGLLTQGSVLTVGGDNASMVTRGLFVLHDLLYSAVGNAPPGTDTTPIPTKPGLSQRAITEQRLANNSCTNCHSKFEPLAFALEKFDGVGAFHNKDRHGNVLREDGELLIPGDDKPIPFKTAREFADILAGSERVRMNFTRKVAQFAIGRPLTNADDEALKDIHAEAQKNGGTYAAVISAIVMSDLIRTTQTESTTKSGLTTR